ncbi:hypothetical protein CMV_013571 [Castanea mollissima]|uniref:Uncharacterized protein n=1 Tax=Castanea mollissima TaxID=60419 RepID=A0A8J4VUT2_9ROSI|nr:hypothetical protein CMV_013571 [Castanea mollissima]
MAYLKSNAFLLLGLLFAVVALISSESSAREQVPSQTYESDSMEEANINAELLKERNRERSIHRKCSNRGHRGPGAVHDVETHEVVGTKTKDVMF